MLFKEQKILLMHPGKTGGTSLEDALINEFLGKEFEDFPPNKAFPEILYGLSPELHVYYHHADLLCLRKLGVDISGLQGYVTCRRPYERILSAYYYNGKNKEYPDFNVFVKKGLIDLLGRNKEYSVNHFTKQVHYYQHGFKILKLEEIDTWHEEFGIKPISKRLAKTLASKKSDYLQAYNERSKRLVEDLYKEDFTVFDYEMVK